MTPKNGGLLSMALSYCGFVDLSVRAVMLKGMCSPIRRTHQAHWRRKFARFFVAALSNVEFRPQGF